jgi:glutamate formiminotransferase/formiminotetrahydrofolate cyclodeaminase
MSMPLVECIPNFSEARRPEVVEDIVQVIAAVPGIHVLDRHSDMDHNRTVVTFVGPPESVEEAAYQSIARSSQLINLDEHTGEHPRIGATDVVPFVPIRDISMVECVELARRLGKRVGESLQIPVYLYEEAAATPERHNLENIRRGQYEALKEEMGKQPERKPDFGPEKVGTAGATVIGARQPLIAFNVYLTTDDVSIAQKIAKAMRQSSGGWRFIKGMGVLVEGRAQVSMNMTNYRQTPISRVVESIRREAQRYGVSIHHTELVGLIPQEALTDASIWYLQLDGFKPEQVLETRMYDALRDKSSESSGPDFVTTLAAGTPTPGGGSASAYAAAMGAALICMVSRLTIGKKKYAEVEPQMWGILDKAEPLQAELRELVTRDSEAFEDLMQATRLPKEKPEDQQVRSEAITKATLHAAAIPLEVCRNAITVMELAIQAVQMGNLNAISDAASGFAMAQAALRGAGWNVQINLLSMSDSARAQAMLSELTLLNSKTDHLWNDLTQSLQSRGGIS